MDEVESLKKELRIMKKKMNLLLTSQRILEDKQEDDNRLYKNVVAQLQEAQAKAEAANHAKSEFLANMSHEIRTPMNAVLGFTEILYSLETEPRKKHFIENIRTSGKALLNLINDILDLSKIEAGKMELQYSAVSIPHLVQEMHTVFNQKVTEKGINFQINLADTIPESLILDETRLRQVLINLIGNAVKFTDTGHVRLSAAGKQTDITTQSRFDLSLSVEDTGVGIPEDQQDKIFGAFEQTKGQKTAQFGGTGLGLAITNRLVEIMGGTITVESAVGMGTTFTIELKGVEIAAAEALSSHDSGEVQVDAITFEPATILIADDIDFNRELLATLLDSQNFTILYAENGQEAIEQVGKEHPDLILLDMKMPVMDGYEASEKLKSNDQTKDIPIIAITASALKQDEEVIRKTCDGYLRKPIDKKELFHKLMKFLPFSKDERKQNVIVESSEYPVTIEGLSKELLTEIRRVVDICDFYHLNDILNRIQKMDPKYEGFCHQVEQYSRRFDGEAIIRLLDSFTS